MSRPRKLKMKVIVVGPGEIAANPRHPHADKSPEQRRERMLQILASALAKLAVPPSIEAHRELAKKDRF